MAFHIGDSDDQVLADINVTPLVDVMLVLLIVFMIAAPMLHQGIAVDLPKADQRALPMRQQDPLVVSVSRDGIVYLRDTPVHPTQLVERLLPILESREDKLVFLKGDREVPFGSVIEVLDVLQQGGITEVGMVTETPPRGSGR
ncbi:MAG: ExbD/TolR family protein [Acidobacteriota bacterium]